MFLRKRLRPSFAFVSLALASVVVAGATALASQSLLRDRVFSQTQIDAGVAKAQANSGIPIVWNEMVLERVYRYVGTATGRTFMKESLVRMKLYEEMIRTKLEVAHVPIELLAVPLSESGYRNIKRGVGGGLWGFIVSTAKRYGLVVNEVTDERFDVEKSTDAAIRYFKHIDKKFADWHLAIKSYNEGESRVEAMIAKYGTNNAWELERLEPREHYLSDVMAVMILLKNPEWLD